jgi:hypothetical protein
MLVEIRGAKSEARTARLNEEQVAPPFVLREFLRRCCMDFTLPRQVRVLGIGLILLMVVLYAKTATVIGTITRNNNTPAANVLVSIAGQYRYTDVGGRYRIDGVPVGPQKLTVSSGGKVLLEVGVNIRDQMSVFNLKVP